MLDLVYLTCFFYLVVSECLYIQMCYININTYINIYIVRNINLYTFDAKITLYDHWPFEFIYARGYLELKF